MKRFTLIELLIVIAILVIFGSVVGGTVFGGCTGGMGPRNTITINVTDKYVDSVGDAGSHYMVACKEGVFEVNNGPLLGVWNADEIYARLERGKTYKVVTKGIKSANWFRQEYPYIVEILEDKTVVSEPVSANSEKNLDNMTVSEVQAWAKKNGVKVEISPTGTNPVVER